MTKKKNPASKKPQASSASKKSTQKKVTPPQKAEEAKQITPPPEKKKAIVATLNPRHTDEDFRMSRSFFIRLQRYVTENPGGFSFANAIAAPGSIDCRQRTERVLLEFKEPATQVDRSIQVKRGDYMFRDTRGGKLLVPYSVFSKLTQ